MDVSRWTTGSPYATFTGSWKQTAPNILEVTSVTSESIKVGHSVYGSGISAGTKIKAFQSGPGGVGTYELSNPQSLFYSNVMLYSGFYPGSDGNTDIVFFPANSGS